jgi:hypothetical protein
VTMLTEKLLPTLNYLLYGWLDLGELLLRSRFADHDRAGVRSSQRANVRMGDAKVGSLREAVTQQPAVLGPGLMHSMTAVGIVFSPSVARVRLSQALVAKQRGQAGATVSFGCPPWRIVLRHVIPNSIQPVVIQATFLLGLAVIAEASLS